MLGAGLSLGGRGGWQSTCSSNDESGKIFDDILRRLLGPVPDARGWGEVGCTSFDAFA